MQHQNSSDSPGLLRRFFSGLGRAVTWLRVTLSNVLFFGLLVILVLALSPEAPTPLPDEFALRLSPSGYLVDEKTYVDPVEMLLQSSSIAAETRVRDLVRAIDEAATDSRVTGLVLELDDLQGGGISKLEEIGAALERFKDSGKPVLARGQLFSQDQYYLASHAETVYLHDMGMVVLTGYDSYRHYFKEALDKLSVNIHVFRAGRYKDFVEPFTRNDMSNESREHTAQWLTQLWGVYASRIEELRGLPSGALNDHINTMDERLGEFQGDAAALALKSGLVDSLMNHREQRNTLIQKFGHHPSEKDYNAVDWNVYLAERTREQRITPGKVGLLVARGNIMEGQQPEGSIGSDTFLEQIEQVRSNDEIKALVVRIDSGGGSAFASEIIRTELDALRAEGMPVLISMGSVAASGGYWVAASGDEIWATPTTLTGSIGVFGIFPTFEGSLQKLGVNTDGLGTTDLTGATRLDTPLSPKAEAVIQQNVEHIYQRFVGLVAEARGMSPAEVDRMAQGRVWSGATAHELGLVDHLGGLEEVIAAAAERAGLSRYQVQTIQRPLSPVERLARELQENQVSTFVPESLTSRWLRRELEHRLGPLLRPLKTLEQMDSQGVYARCVECLAP